MHCGLLDIVCLSLRSVVEFRMLLRLVKFGCYAGFLRLVRSGLVVSAQLTYKNILSNYALLNIYKL